MNSTITPEKANVMTHEQQRKTTQTQTANNKGIIRVNDFDASQLTMSTPRKNKDRINTYLLQNGEPLYVESPWLRTPFGISSFEAKSTGTKEWSINISAPSADSVGEDNDAINNWFNQWIQVDQYLVQKGVEFQDVLFGKGKKSAEVVQALYTPVVKGQDTAYPVRLQPKINKARDSEDKQKVLENVPDVILFEKGHSTQAEFETFDELAALVPKNSMVKLILQPKIWCISGKFGLSLRVLQILVQRRNSTTPKGYAFSDAVDEEADADDEENQADTEQADSEKEEQADSDAVDEEEVEEEAEAED
jgi:hypothetical protein